jgi:aryl-alcohol dehydrogenase-like predicted oxidoreductase
VSGVSCEELGIGFVPWSPLGQGFLTGKVDADQSFAASDIRSPFPRFTVKARNANQPLVDVIAKIAAGKNAKPAQIALAWLLAQKAMDRPDSGYPQTVSPGGEPGGIREIDDATATVTVQGARGTGDEEYG